MFDSIDLKGAISVFFPAPSFEMIYFEAVANAIDAGATHIKIDIQLESFHQPDTLQLKIEDNGMGFTEERFGRFKKLLSPEDTSHKGLGRLVYLRYFKQVYLDSFFKRGRRSFEFSEDFTGVSQTESSEKAETGSCFLFKNFIGQKLSKYNDLKPSYLKDELLQHFFPVFYERKTSDSELEIEISLDVKEGNEEYRFFSDTCSLSVNDLPEFKTETFHPEGLSLIDDITVFYRVEKNYSGNKNHTLISVDGRTIPIDLSLSKSSIPAPYEVNIIFSSNFLQGQVDSSRQKLKLKDDSLEKILKYVLRKKVSEILESEIPEITENNSKVKARFEKKYPHLLGYFEEDTVGIIDKNEAIEQAQKKFFKDQKDILECESLNDSQYEKSLDVSSRLLTEYVLYRSLIIKKMRELNKDDSESDIHNLIVPQRKVFKGGELADDFYQNNAWLLDDKYMTYNTILSEARMDTVIKAITLDDDVKSDAKRPDIAMVFSNDPEEAEKVDVVVVELKKQTDDEKDNLHAVTQLMQRAEKLAEFENKIQRIWYYAVIQVNDSLSKRLTQMNWNPLYSQGKVFYQEFKTFNKEGEVIPTPTYVLSFDTLISDAETRNNVFLEVLKDGIKRAARNESG